ncbi:EF-hand calcium-binding domain-containing protein 10-like [Liolophura sinensis]|uniref:EF-hand calcium-binding domain-containing protein 10-like n=1 Tax=Liolophura sinensis TaxID=3198878 RepID=UPI0031595F37
MASEEKLSTSERVLPSQSKKPKMTNDTWPLQQEATDYLEKHKIMELFNNMTAQLIFNRPDHPKIFMTEMLEQLQKSKTTHMDYPCLFDDSNIQSVFGMLDPTGSGCISLKQYTEAMKTLGVVGYEEVPAGGDIDKISFETFLKEARTGLNQGLSNFPGTKGFTEVDLMHNIFDFTWKR